MFNGKGSRTAPAEMKEIPVERHYVALNSYLLPDDSHETAR